MRSVEPQTAPKRLRAERLPAHLLRELHRREGVLQAHVPLHRREAGRRRVLHFQLQPVVERGRRDRVRVRVRVRCIRNLRKGNSHRQEQRALKPGRGAQIPMRSS